MRSKRINVSHAPGACSGGLRHGCNHLVNRGCGGHSDQGEERQACEERLHCKSVTTRYRAEIFGLINRRKNYGLRPRLFRRFLILERACRGNGVRHTRARWRRGTVALGHPLEQTNYCSKRWVCLSLFSRSSHIASFPFVTLLCIESQLNPLEPCSLCIDSTIDSYGLHALQGNSVQY